MSGKNNSVSTTMKVPIPPKNEDGKLQCPAEGCERTYTDARHLRLHYKGKHFGVKYPCTFDGCTAVYTLQTSLRSHIKQKHENGPAAKCPIVGCGQEFSISQQLQRHLKRDHAVSEKHRCGEPLCDMLFPDGPTLQRHLKSSHQQLDYSCPVVSCAKHYPWATSLHIHMGTTRNDVVCRTKYRRLPCYFASNVVYIHRLFRSFVGCLCVCVSLLLFRRSPTFRCF